MKLDGKEEVEKLNYLVWQIMKNEEKWKGRWMRGIGANLISSEEKLMEWKGEKVWQGLYNALNRLIKTRFSNSFKGIYVFCCKHT